MNRYELGKLESIDFLLKPLFFFSKTLSQFMQCSSIIILSCNKFVRVEWISLDTISISYIIKCKEGNMHVTVLKLRHEVGKSFGLKLYLHSMTDNIINTSNYTELHDVYNGPRIPEQKLDISVAIVVHLLMPSCMVIIINRRHVLTCLRLYILLCS